MRCATLGTISYGLQQRDLLAAFASALDSLVTENLDLPDSRYIDLLSLIEKARRTDPDAPQADVIMDRLVEELNSFAGPGCYFGPREGERSDFGFWQCAERGAEPGVLRL